MNPPIIAVILELDTPLYFSDGSYHLFRGRRVAGHIVLPISAAHRTMARRVAA